MSKEILIGIGGKKGAGKTYCTDFLLDILEEEGHGPVGVSNFGDAVKYDCYKHLFTNVDFFEYKWGNWYSIDQAEKEKEYEELAIMYLQHVLFKNWLEDAGYSSAIARSKRFYFQKYSDYIKELFGKDYYINKLYKNLEWRCNPISLIGDVRYQSELESVKQRGGFTIYIDNPLNPYNKMNDTHPSESETNACDFDYIVYNTGIEGTKEVLKQQLLAILEEEGISINNFL